MHLIETYATNCGLKIASPTIYEKYIPVPNKKYIVLQAHSKPSKSYDYWQEVIDILHPILTKAGIQIIQIGENGEKPYGGVINYIGHTDLGQCAYIIRNSLLHLGVDSFGVHIASSFDKPIVALYSNNNINNVGPYWSSKDKVRLLEPYRANGERPSYSLNEVPKTINKIAPEKVASSVCELLELPFTFDYKYLWTGELYNNKTLELIPDNAVALQQFGVDFIIVRMDYLFDEKILEHQMNLGKVIIITDKKINTDLLKRYKNRINQLVYIIEKDNDPNFIKEIYTDINKISLISFLPSEEVDALKIDYMDYGIIFKKSECPPKEILNVDYNNLYYKNGKFLLARQKIYSSRDTWEKDLPLPNFTPTINSASIINPKSKFWRESEHYSFLVKK